MREKKYLAYLIKYSGILVFSLIMYHETFSAPAINKIISFYQADGSTISLMLKGDEYFHYYSTLDGIPVFQKDESFYYGFFENKTLTITDLIVHEKEIRTQEELSFIAEHNEVFEHIKSIHTHAIDSENERRMAKKTKKNFLGEVGDYAGTKKGLVILVNFADLTFTSEKASIYFYNMFNLPGFNQNGSIGSVRDYFLDQSYGKFDLSFDVIGPITVSKNFSYYGSNSIETGQDSRPYEMVIEACNIINDIVDFKDYDWDGDDEVDQVFIIYAGHGENAGASSNTIWPHESHLNKRKINLDGVDIDTYACSCELSGNQGFIPNGIGTSCHEFSHCLGLPDLYDTDYSGAFGMSYWDIMNSGSFNGPNGIGEIPYGYSAFERWYVGWMDLTEISETHENLELRDLGTYPEAFVIYNEGNRDEYFIMENHQSDRWFQYVNNNKDMHGMMISHIDYDKNAWINNIVNPNIKHQRLSIIPADNSYGSSEKELRGDLFPGLLNITCLTKESHLNTGGLLFNPNLDDSHFMHLAVGNIKEHNGILSFNIVNTYDLPIPQVREATNISSDGYIANWYSLPDAEYYIIEKKATYLWNDIIPVSKEETYKICDSTSCLINWSFDNYNEMFRVKGIIKGIPTEWSDYQSVTFSNSIEMLPDDNKNEFLHFYNLNGTKYNNYSPGIKIIINGYNSKKIMTHK